MNFIYEFDLMKYRQGYIGYKLGRSWAGLSQVKLEVVVEAYVKFVVDVGVQQLVRMVGQLKLNSKLKFELSLAIWLILNT